MSYHLGIDLGTTYTAAATHVAGRIEVVRLGDRGPSIPSVVFLRPDGNVVAGDTANRQAVTAPERVAREFKRRLGDPTPISLGGVPTPPELLTGHLLRWVYDVVVRAKGAVPGSVALTHPANWGNYKGDLLRRAAETAGLTEVSLVTEPQAAAISYASQERVEAGAVVAVYDLGGGTFDAAVLRKEHDGGFTILGTPEGIDRLGGIDFDAAVFDHVRQALDGVFDDLDPDDDATVAAVARLRQECTQAKEALSLDSEAIVPVLLPSTQTEVRVTRSELESMIRPALAETVTALERALRSADMGAGDVSHVLLVGGSSRIPVVAEMVSAELGRPVAIDAHPKHAVALGAAIVAARAVGVTVGDALNGTPSAIPGAPVAAPITPPFGVGLPPIPVPGAAPGAPPLAGVPAGGWAPGVAASTVASLPAPPAANGNNGAAAGNGATNGATHGQAAGAGVASAFPAGSAAEAADPGGMRVTPAVHAALASLPTASTHRANGAPAPPTASTDTPGQPAGAWSSTPPSSPSPGSLPPRPAPPPSSPTGPHGAPPPSQPPPPGSASGGAYGAPAASPPSAPAPGGAYGAPGSSHLGGASTTPGSSQPGGAYAAPPPPSSAYGAPATPGTARPAADPTFDAAPREAPPPSLGYQAASRPPPPGPPPPGSSLDLPPGYLTPEQRHHAKRKQVRKGRWGLLAGVVVVVVGIAVTVVLTARGSSPQTLTDIAVGECFQGEDVSDLTVVDCAQPHNGELFAVIDAEGLPDDYMGEEALLTDRANRCVVALTVDYYGAGPEVAAANGIEIKPFVPTESDWNDGRRDTYCVAAPAGGGTVEGTIEGAGGGQALPPPGAVPPPAPGTAPPPSMSTPADFGGAGFDATGP